VPRLSFFLLVALGALGGCGDDAMPPPTDGGVDAVADGGGDVSVAAPAMPMAPASPDFGGCRPGWTAEDVAGVNTCAPLPDPVPTCADHEAIFPGDAACVRVGEACGGDGWPTALPATGVVHVRAGASGGDGTRAAPLGTIGDATAVVSAGETIALATGDYVESVALPAGVTLRGACVEQTTIRTTATVGVAPTLEVTGADARIENLTLTGARPGIRVRGGGTSARISDVIIDGATSTGLSIANGGEVTAERVVVRGTRSSGGAFGRGINVEFGSTLTLTRGAITGNRETGILALEGSTVLLEDVWIEGTRAVDGFGDGIGAELGSTVEARGCVLEGCEGVGAYVTTDATMTLEDCIVRDNLQEGLQVSFGASLTLARARIEDNLELGILTEGEGAATTASDVIFRGHGFRATSTQAGGTLSLTRALVAGNGTTEPKSGLYVNGRDGVFSTMTLRDVRVDGHAATGIEALSETNVELERIAVTGTTGSGVHLTSDGMATVRDLRVENTLPDPDGLFGRGLEANEVGSLTLERGYFASVQEVGVLIGSSPVTISDVTILDVASHPGDNLYGHGLELQASTGSVERLHIERARGTALLISMGSTIAVNDVEVLDTQSNGPFLFSGHALTVNSGAQVDIVGARFVDNREATVAVFEPETMLTMTGVEIRRSLPRQCDDPRCGDFLAGIGIGVYESARARMSDFLITDSALAGVQLAVGELDLEDGVIANNPIGINVQDPSYPFERLTVRVALRNNERNVDSEMLPVPDGVAPSGM